MRTFQRVDFVPAIFGKVAPTPSGGGPRPSRFWDYDSFFEELRDSQDDTVIQYVTAVYEEFREWTDEELWGSGTTYGSFNLVVLNGDLRVNMAAITTSGILYVTFEYLTLTSKVPQEVIDALRDDLESIDGVSFPADVSRRNPRVPEVALRDPTRLRAVLSAIKSAVDSVHAL